jgi:protein-tyrosine phosphatase
VLDLTAPTPAQLDEAVAFIAANIERGIVYVHCKAGYSRAAAVVGAYLLEVGGANDPQEATTLLRTARPAIVIRPEVLRALCNYAATLAPPPVFAAIPSPTAPQR